MEIFTNLPSLISDAVEANQWIGYAAILLAMFLENIIPPIPSEIIMPLGGYYVFAGKLDFFPVIYEDIASYWREQGSDLSQLESIMEEKKQKILDGKVEGFMLFELLTKIN